MALDEAALCRKVNVFLSLFVALFSTTFPCPLQCVCGDDGMPNLQCIKANLTTIPAGIPPASTSLTFIETQIRSIPENAFQGLPNVEEIDFDTNPAMTRVAKNAFRGISGLTSLKIVSSNLSDVSGDSFKGLTALTELFLTDSHLTRLPDDVFRDLANLKSLDLKRNKLTTISVNLLTGLSKLTYLSLSHNRISSISEGAFLPVKQNLMHLNLDSNQLSEFPITVLENFTSLVDLRLTSNNFSTVPLEAKPVFDMMDRNNGNIWIYYNPLICTKELKWLQTWMKEHPTVVRVTEYLTCNAPDGNSHQVLNYDFSLLDKLDIGPLKNNTTVSPPTSSTTSSTTSSSKSSTTSSSTSSTTSSSTSPNSPNTKSSLAPTATTKKALLTTLKEKSTARVTNKITEAETPTSTLKAFTANSNTFVSTPSLTKDSETKKTSLTRNEEVVLVSSLVGVFLIVFVGVMLYCFRRKLLLRQRRKTPLGSPAMYDRVSGVVKYQSPQML